MQTRRRFPELLSVAPHPRDCRCGHRSFPDNVASVGSFTPEPEALANIEVDPVNFWGMHVNRRNTREGF